MEAEMKRIMEKLKAALAQGKDGKDGKASAPRGSFAQGGKGGKGAGGQGGNGGSAVVLGAGVAIGGKGGDAH
jgi:hypothetical protein